MATAWAELPPVVLCRVACSLTPCERLRARLVNKAWMHTLNLGVHTLHYSGLLASNSADRKCRFPDFQLLHVNAQARQHAQHAPVPLPTHFTHQQCDLCTACSAATQLGSPGLHLRCINTINLECQGSSEYQNIRHLTLTLRSKQNLTPTLPETMLQTVSQHCPGLKVLHLPQQGWTQPSNNSSSAAQPWMALSTVTQLQELSCSLPTHTVALPADAEVGEWSYHSDMTHHYLALQRALQHAPQSDTTSSAPAAGTAGAGAAAGVGGQDVHGVAPPPAALQQQAGQQATAFAVPHTRVPAAAVLLSSVPHLTYLALLNQCDLSDPWIAASLAALTQLTSLHMSSAFVAQPYHLTATLTHLTHLKCLTLHFGTEWWVHASDLHDALRCMPALASLSLAVDYGLAGDELEDALRDEAQEKDDWGGLQAALPSLQQLRLQLDHARPAVVLHSLMRPTAAAPECTSAAVTLLLNDPLPNTDKTPLLPQLPNALHSQARHMHLTCLHLGAAGSGMLVTPAEVQQLAQLTSLTRLHLAATLHAGAGSWPSVAQVSKQLQELWAQQWPDRTASCPIPAISSTEGDHTWPGNPLVFFSLLARLQHLVLHISSPLAQQLHGLLTATDGLDAEAAEDIWDDDDDKDGDSNSSDGNSFDADDSVGQIACGMGGGRNGARTRVRGAQGAVHVLGPVLQPFPAAQRWLETCTLQGSDSTAAEALGAGMGQNAAELHYRQQQLVAYCMGIADSACTAWLRSMQYLQQLSLSGCGCLSEQGALTELGQHRSLQVMHLALDGPQMPQHSPTTAAEQQQQQQGTATAEQQALVEPAGDQQPVAAVPTAAASAATAAAASTLAAAASMSTAAGMGAGARSQQPVLVVPAAAGDDRLTGSTSVAVAVNRLHPSLAAEQAAWGSGGGHSAPGSSFQYLMSLPASAGWRLVKDSIGSAGSHQTNAYLTASIQPHISLSPAHLPQQLHTLELHNVRFSREWENNGSTRSLPRLLNLTITNSHGLKSVMLQEQQPEQLQGVDATQTALPTLPEQPMQEVLPSTMITNWHLKYVVARQPVLTQLVIQDRVLGDRGQWVEQPSSAKLKSRGVSQLAALQYLTKLDLQVGHRMGWPAQEGLINTLRSLTSLKQLYLGATNLYTEAYQQMTCLTQLLSLQVEPSYQLEAQEMQQVLHQLSAGLPYCDVQQLNRFY